MKKYELTTETLQFAGRTLHRIKAVKDFGSIQAGEFGGFIEKEENLSQDDNAWIYVKAMAFDNANVFGNAKILGNAKVYDNANVFGNAKILGNAEILGNANVFGNAEILGNAKVYDNAMVYGNADILGNAKISCNAKVYGYAKVYDNANIDDYAEVYGRVVIKGDAKVHDATDYIVFKNFWSSGRYFTWTRSNNKWSVGCFYGTGEELIKKAYNDSEKSGREYERVVRYVESILADEKKEKSN